MKSELFSKFKTKYQSLNQREKWLFKLAIAIISLLLIERAVITPVFQYQNSLKIKLAEKTKALSDLQGFIKNKDFQKVLFKGKVSDFLVILSRLEKESLLNSVKIKKTESSDKGFQVEFESSGQIQAILNFILKMENLDFLIQFQSADIGFLKGSEYRFNGLILVKKE